MSDGGTFVVKFVANSLLPPEKAGRGFTHRPNGHKKVLYYGRWAPPGEIGELADDIFYWMGTGKPGVVVDSTIGSRAFAEGRRPDFSNTHEILDPVGFTFTNLIFRSPVAA